MASKLSTVEFLAGQVTEAGNIRFRKMFGEYALYCDEKVFAFICDDKLFIKPTNAGRTYIGKPEEAPAYPGSKMYFLISEDYWDDAQWLTELVKTSVTELPLPKKKLKK